MIPKDGEIIKDRSYDELLSSAKEEEVEDD